MINFTELIRYKLILTEGSFELAEAYWIKPSGKMLPTRMTHIDMILRDPELFGFTFEYIKKIHDDFGERLGQEGKARAQLIRELISKGWMRIRHYPRQGRWTINLNKLTRKTKDFIQGFSELVISHKGDKYDNVTVDTLKSSKNHTMLELSNDALYK